MAHTKPQVIIDLDEYNELQARAKLTPSIKDIQELRVHRLLLDALIRNKGDMKQALIYMYTEYKITLSAPTAASIPKSEVIPMNYKEEIG